MKCSGGGTVLDASAAASALPRGHEPAVADIVTTLLPSPHAGTECWIASGFFKDRWVVEAAFWRCGAGDAPLAAAYLLADLCTNRRWRASYTDTRFIDRIDARIDEGFDDARRYTYDAYRECRDADRVYHPCRLAPRGRHVIHPHERMLFDMGAMRLDIGTRPAVLRARFADDTMRCELTANLESDRQSGLLPMPANRHGVTECGALRVEADIRIDTGGEIVDLSGPLWLEHQSRRHLAVDFTALADHRALWTMKIDLDNGASLVFHGDDASRLQTVGYVCASGAAWRALSSPRLGYAKPVQSLRTCKLYPVCESLRFDAGDRLAFEPCEGDFELYVMGSQRGYLAQPYRVSGMLAGECVAGSAMFRTSGETPELNRFFWGTEKTSLSTQMEAFLPRTVTPSWLRRVCGKETASVPDASSLQTGLLDPVWSMIDRGGKGWRSSWLSTCCHALVPEFDDRRVTELLPCIELIHTGSLVIDDIQDCSTMRRGQPTLHRQIGTDLAINVGNFMYFLPMMLVDEIEWLNAEQRLAIYEIVMRSMRQGHVGQALDLMWTAGRYDLRARLRDIAGTRDELVEHYRLKSGYHLEAVARIAGVVTDAENARVEAAAGYSCAYGVVFQIVDDIVGMQEAVGKLGKEEGEDIRNGKANMLLLFALEGVAAPRREAIVEEIFSNDLERGLDMARALVRETHAVERCVEFAAALADEAWSAMVVLPASDAKIVMRSTLDWLLHERTTPAPGDDSSWKTAGR